MLKLIIKLMLILPVVASAQSPVNVDVAPLSEVVVEQNNRAPGRVVSANTSVIAAELSATVASIKADVGSVVEAGDVLIELDPEDYRLALSQTQASLAANEARITQAELRLKRAEELSGNQYISADELLARTTDLAVLKADRKAIVAQLRVAERNFSKTTIRAPFAGVVTERSANVGALAVPGSPLLTLVDHLNSEVEAEIPATLASTVYPNAPYFLEFANQVYLLNLERLSPVIDSRNRNQLARFSFTADAAPAGASGDLVWQTAGGLIPASLVVRRDGELGVFVARGGMAEFVSLPQAQEGRPVATVLADDTPIIVAGRQRLQNGDAIRITER